jgi:hypothetical protein
MRNVFGGLAAVVLLLALVLPAYAGRDKVYVCHAAGQSGTTKFVTIYVPATETGYPVGHFTESGTQLAGHEDDYLGQCKEEQQSPTPVPSSSPSTSPSATPDSTSSPSMEPSPTPEPTLVPPTPSLTPQPTSEPSSSPSPNPEESRAPTPTLPPTDTEG